MTLANWTWGPISQLRCLQPRGALLGFPAYLLLPHAAWHKEDILGYLWAPQIIPSYTVQD